MESKIISDKLVNRVNLEQQAFYTSPNFLQNFTYSGPDLGLTYTPDQAVFRVWAPTSRYTRLHLYSASSLDHYQAHDHPQRALDMARGVKGTWEVTVPEDLNGWFYTYAVELPRINSPTSLQSTISALSHTWSWSTPDLARNNASPEENLNEAALNGFYHAINKDNKANENKNNDLEYEWVEVIDPYAKAVSVNGAYGAICDIKKATEERIPGWDEDYKWRREKNQASFSTTTTMNDQEVNLSNDSNGQNHTLVNGQINGHSSIHGTGKPLSLPTDAIVYEFHVRDMTIHPSSGVQHKGQYLGMTEENTVSPDGLTTGLSHLCELGVTHVQILPIFDYEDVDETRPFEHYNWGYNPSNYNAPEGSYATNPYDPLSRIIELKKMIKTFHDHHIKVIMDVVYNHTYRTKDSNFNKIVPGYFYRMNNLGKFSNGSGCGNEIASERPMVRKYILDSIQYWVNEFHLDGFRFDLMGLIDIDTMAQIRQMLDQVDPEIIIYGEGWTCGDTPLPSGQRSTRANATNQKLINVGMFNDEIRDTLVGSVFDQYSRGFATSDDHLLDEKAKKEKRKEEEEEEEEKRKNGENIEHKKVNKNWYYNKEILKVVISGSIAHPCCQQICPRARTPSQVVNYVSCHDNLCLWDKINKATAQTADEENRKKMIKLAMAVVMFSQGIPFIHEGEEILRTKKMDSNSYKSGDLINALDWSKKKSNYDVFTYFKNLIQFRKKHPAFRMNTPMDIWKNLTFIDMDDLNTIGVIINNHANHDSYKTMLIIFNAEADDIEIQLPDCSWSVVFCDLCNYDDVDVDVNGIVQDNNNHENGITNQDEKEVENKKLPIPIMDNTSVIIPGISTVVFADTESVENKIMKN